jgi:hypothetical protein
LTENDLLRAVNRWRAAKPFQFSLGRLLKCVTLLSVAAWSGSTLLKAGYRNELNAASAISLLALGCAACGAGIGCLSGKMLKGAAIGVGCCFGVLALMAFLK